MHNKIPYEIFGMHHIDYKTINQFFNAIDYPWVVQAALMPDAHLGYTMPIGGVASTCGYVVPVWVGYDQGCGVCAVRTTFPAELIREKTDLIYEAIRDKVPVGFKHHRSPVHTWRPPTNTTSWWQELFSVNGLNQLGTLGGGNHFIEIANDEFDNIWIVVHSGSRNLGHKTATRYIKLAHPDGKCKEGTYELEADSNEGWGFIIDMNANLAFALENRKAIVTSVMYAIQQAGIPGIPASSLDITGPDFINRNHNHAELNSNGMWVHRKGATHAEKGMLGIIPGNMANGSYIVSGLGNPGSICSSSHGAGRTYSRKQAKAELDINDFKNRMIGITAKVEHGTLDESPMAYKDFNLVMEDQKDLVEIINHLTPIINVKG